MLNRFIYVLLIQKILDHCLLNTPNNAECEFQKYIIQIKGKERSPARPASLFAPADVIYGATFATRRLRLGNPKGPV